MTTQVTVFGTNSDGLVHALRRAFPALDTSRSVGRGVLLRDGSRPVILIAADGEAVPDGGTDRAVIVTCGMARRDSVSVSSFGEERTVISLVRELPVLGGGTLEEQDVILAGSGGLTAEELAMAAAALLCSGFAPADTGAFFRQQPF